MSTTTTEPTSLALALFGAQVMGWDVRPESKDVPEFASYPHVWLADVFTAGPQYLYAEKEDVCYVGWNPAEDDHQANMVAKKMRSPDLFIEIWTGSIRSTVWRVNIHERLKQVHTSAEDPSYPRALMLTLYRAYQEMQKTV